MNLLDVTLRDGSYAIDYQFTCAQVQTIVRALECAGITHIELGHGSGLGAHEILGLPAAATDAAYFKAARAVVNNAKLGAIAGPICVCTPEIFAKVSEYLDFMRIACNGHDIASVLPTFQLARNKGLPIFAQFMRSSRCTTAQLIASAKIAAAEGACAIYVVDTAGAYTPDEVRVVVKALQDAVSLPIGFHGHNNLGLANANALAAIDAGATWIDASLRGMGRGAGNTQLEALLTILHRRELCKNIALPPLLACAESLIAPLVQHRLGVEAVEILTGGARIDLYPLSTYAAIAHAAEISLMDFIAALGNAGAESQMIEIDIVTIHAALRTIGKDPESIFAQLRGHAA